MQKPCQTITGFMKLAMEIVPTIAAKVLPDAGPAVFENMAPDPSPSYLYQYPPLFFKSSHTLVESLHTVRFYLDCIFQCLIKPLIVGRLDC